VEIVQEYMARDARIQLYVQGQREGKTSAINVFLAHAKEGVCVLKSGDTLPVRIQSRDWFACSAIRWSG